MDMTPGAPDIRTRRSNRYFLNIAEVGTILASSDFHIGKIAEVE
jgi:hypothetical protein